MPAGRKENPPQQMERNRDRESSGDGKKRKVGGKVGYFRKRKF